MGKHFSEAELDAMQKWKADGMGATEVHKRMQRARRRGGMSGPDLTSVRRALKGTPFKRSRVETRGRPRILTQPNVRALESTRRRLISKADGEFEVHWDDVIHAARVPLVHRTTAARNLKEAGYDIQWRTPRLKPARSAGDQAQRAGIFDNLMKLPE